MPLEMLISAVMPIMYIYRLCLGQYGYSEHVINLSQDVASFASNLPRLPSKLDAITVTKEGANQSHRGFRVRRSSVNAISIFVLLPFLKQEVISYHIRNVLHIQS